MLILVRHGRTAANAAGQLQGRLDQPLDDLGERQALAVAAHVGAVDEVISSPLLRARQTAEAFGRPVNVDERWIEIAYGKYEGMPHGDVPVRGVELLAHRRRLRARGRRVGGRRRRTRPARV